MLQLFLTSANVNIRWKIQVSTVTNFWITTEKKTNRCRQKLAFGFFLIVLKNEFLYFEIYDIELPLVTDHKVVIMIGYNFLYCIIFGY